MARTRRSHWQNTTGLSLAASYEQRSGAAVCRGDVFPALAEALFWANTAIEQDRSNAGQQGGSGVAAAKYFCSSSGMITRSLCFSPDSTMIFGTAGNAFQSTARGKARRSTRRRLLTDDTCKLAASQLGGVSVDVLGGDIGENLP